MKLTDEIIDEAEQLASNRVLNDPTDADIIEAVSDIVGVDLHPQSIGARLAVAAYNRIDNVAQQCA
jgi:hypothetical protein